MIYTTSNTTFHSFDAFSSSLKWKRRLSKISTIISRPHQNQQHHYTPWNAYHHTPATVIAAATEKFAPRSNHQYALANPNSGGNADIEIHSEDLTASQFAFMAGIKTHKRNSYQSSHATSACTAGASTSDYMETDESDDDDEDYEEESDSNVDSPENNGRLFLKVPSHHDIMMEQQQTTTTAYTLSQKSAPVLRRSSSTSMMKIWDSHFWQQPQKDEGQNQRCTEGEVQHAVAAVNETSAVHPTSTTSVPPSNATIPPTVVVDGSNTAASSTLSTSSASFMSSSLDKSSLLLQPQTQPLIRNQSAPSHQATGTNSTTRCSMIQKGRFKIVWGQEAELEEEKLLSSSVSVPLSAVSNTAANQKNCVEWKRKRAGSHGNTPSTH